MSESMPTATSPRSMGMGIIGRYAMAHGFRKDNDGRFSHEDGGWIARNNGARFPWERYGAGGRFARCHLSRDHCLEREPLRINAEIRRLTDSESLLYALLLADTRGGPIEMTVAA